MTDNVKAVKEITVSSGTMASMTASSIRFGGVEGYGVKKNDIIYHSPKQQSANGNGCVVFFGGDMQIQAGCINNNLFMKQEDLNNYLSSKYSCPNQFQDYKENMLAHRDNKHFAEWDLESTAAILHSRFPDQAIAIIKPSKMALKTFSCYENFVSVNNFGAPSYEENTNSLKHLRLLLKNGETIIEQYCKPDESEGNLSSKISEVPVTLVGFSKGCVVLNQILYSFHSLRRNPDNELELFVRNIKHMYWLEGGHSGVSETWVTNKSILQSFSNLTIAVQIHVTPYQVLCDTRPRIGKEEKIFRETLCKMDMNVTRKLHFESEPRSLEKHFQVLTSF